MQSSSSGRKIRKTEKYELKENGKKTWSDNEVISLINALRLHGHQNLQQLQNALPGRSADSIKNFLRIAARIATKDNVITSNDVYNLSQWMNTCLSECNMQGVKNYNGALEISVLLKLLSIDGLIENHPLPENAGGIDYAAAYRFLYQTMLGHPVQPVNEATINVVYETLMEINNIVKTNQNIVETLKTHLSTKFNMSGLNVPETNLSKLFHEETSTKNIKTYSNRKTINKKIFAEELNWQEEVPTDSNIDTVISEKSDVCLTLLNLDGDEIPDVETKPSNCNVSNAISPVELDKADLKKNVENIVMGYAMNPLQLPVNWLYDCDLHIEVPFEKVRNFKERSLGNVKPMSIFKCD